MSHFFFAWVGAPPIPAFTLSTTGDVWGGSQKYLGSTWNGELKTTADILTTGVWSEKGPKLSNMRATDGLIAGAQYGIAGPGISIATIVHGVGFRETQTGGINTKFVFDGEDGGTLDPVAEIAENIAVVISTPFDPITGIAPASYIVHLEDPTGLQVGTTYGIAGSGIPLNAVFTYEGGNEITMSHPATATGSHVELTISLDVGRNVIANLGSAAGLEVGEIYQVFGRGIPAATLGTYQSDGTLLLSQNATLSGVRTFLRIHRGIIYPDGGAFNSSVHARNDETVLSVKIDHSEGNAALLTIELKNPRIGLLAPLRNVWCWLSWQKNSSSPIIPLIHGRLVAIPANIQGEKIALQFLAKPADYDNQRALLSETLKVAPYYDPVWLSNGISTPDSILEARTALWHVDRVNLTVSISDMIIGEDTTLEVGASEHLYSAMGVKFGNPPLTGVYVTGAVTWPQEGSGEVDITREIVQAFRDAGSTYKDNGIISSYCADGLFSDWPKPGASIGAGWTVGLTTAIQRATWLKPIAAESNFAAQPFASGALGLQLSTRTTGGDIAISPADAWLDWTATFPLDVYEIKFFVKYEAKRDWAETVSFFLEADIQEIITDSRSTTESFSLTSSLLTTPIDDGIAPLSDVRHNTYFKLPRGVDSFRFLLAYGAAKLVSRARAVDIDFVVPWEKAVNAGISCRMNVHLLDARLPGGEATGKIIAYELSADAAGGQRAKITIGCTIGRGGSVAASPGVGSYASAGYMASGYQAMLGGTVDLGDNSVTFQTLADFDVVDDGVTLFDMSPGNVIKKLKVIAGPRDQAKAIAMTKTAIDRPFLASEGIVASDKVSIPPKPADALKDAYTVVELHLQSVTGGGFISEFAVDVSKLRIPKTINLEAPSNA